MRTSASDNLEQIFSDTGRLKKCSKPEMSTLIQLMGWCAHPISLALYVSWSREIISSYYAKLPAIETLYRKVICKKQNAHKEIRTIF